MPIFCTFQLSDINDIDFQTSTSTLTCEWSGFDHPHEDIVFYVCLSEDGLKPYFLCERADSKDMHSFHNLNLQPYKVMICKTTKTIFVCLIFSHI